MNEREILRQLLATLAYRGGKSLRDAPAGFAGFDCGQGMAPLAILSHLGDLLEWSLAMAQGLGRWAPAVPTDWDLEVARFHQSLANLDAYVASEAELKADLPRLFQGPIADALTHVGQLSMLRRMAGAPLSKESYFAAEITAGRLGPDQAPARKPL